MKYLFEELIITEEIYLLINNNAPSKSEKEHLLLLVKDIMHHKLVDLILDELPDAQKTEFLTKVDEERHHQYLLENLAKWIDDFESKIIKRAREAEKEMVDLIAKS
jgi:hypothetical protein